MRSDPRRFPGHSGAWARATLTLLAAASAPPQQVGNRRFWCCFLRRGLEWAARGAAYGDPDYARLAVTARTGIPTQRSRPRSATAPWASSGARFAGTVFVAANSCLWWAGPSPYWAAPIRCADCVDNAPPAGRCPKTGWLNRAAAALAGAAGLAIATVMPLMMLARPRSRPWAPPLPISQPDPAPKARPLTVSRSLPPPLQTHCNRRSGRSR